MYRLVINRESSIHQTFSVQTQWKTDNIQDTEDRRHTVRIFNTNIVCLLSKQSPLLEKEINLVICFKLFEKLFLYSYLHIISTEDLRIF